MQESIRYHRKENVKYEIKLYQWMLHYIKKDSVLFVIHLLIMPAQYMAKMLSSAVGFALMLDALIKLDGQIFISGILIYIVGIVVSGILSGVDVFVNGRMECLLRLQMKRDLLSAVLGEDAQSNGGFNKHSGKIMDICTTDIEKVASFPGTQLGNLVTPIVVSFISIIILALKSKCIAVVVFVSLAISLTLNLYFMPKYKKTSENAREEESDFVTAFEEEILGGIVLRIFSMQEHFFSKVDGIARQAYKARKKGIKVRLYHGLIINLLAFSSMTVPFLVGAFQVISGTMEISSLMYVSQIAGNLLWFMDSLAQSVMNLQKVSVSGKRIQDIIAEEDVMREGKPIEIENTGMAIQLRDLSICFGEKEVLKNISLEIPKGSYVAFVGESGSGKSTLLKCIAQLVPYSGSVSVFKREIQKEDKKALRAVISYATQEAAVINGSIYENILLGDLSADADKVKQAGIEAGIDGFVEKMPEKYDTRMEEHGNNFSGGEKQRIALARVFLRHAPIMLLDEITSALDAETEKEILRQLERLRGNVTIVVVAQKLYTVTQADCIFVIKEGRIAESGTHEELLERHGEYEHLLKIEEEVLMNDD